jgi:hypothetical protein
MLPNPHHQLAYFRYSQDDFSVPKNDRATVLLLALIVILCFPTFSYSIDFFLIFISLPTYTATTSTKQVTSTQENKVPQGAQG